MITGYTPRADSAGRLSSSEGYLLFHREGALMAQRFDPGKIELLDEPVAVAERVSFSPAGFSADFSFSGNGTVIYSSGAGTQYQLTWRGPSGTNLGTVAEPGIVNFPALSKDGKRLAFRRVDPTGNYDVWIAELTRAVVTRFTFAPAIDSFPAWSPGGEWLIYSSNSTGTFRVMRKASAGGGDAELLADGGYVSEYSPDGRFVLLYDPGRNGFDVSVLGLTGERKRKTILGSPFNETHPRVSPDGRWLAYTSDEAGTREIYVRRFDPDGPGTGQGWQISNSGGDEPRWRGDGGELYYLSPAGKMMAAAVQGRADQFEAATPRALFETVAESSSNVIWDYDVTRDGQRFIIAEPIGGDTQPLTVLLNWQAGLKR